MKTFTPEIAWHNRDPVYSVDLQPTVQESCLNGVSLASPKRWYRLATSGTNSQVVIWKVWHKINSPGCVDIEPVSQLTRHEKAVNVVRFTPTGENILASADVDGIIILWKLEASNSFPPAQESGKKSKSEPDVVCLSSQSDDEGGKNNAAVKKDEEDEAPNLFEEETIKVEVWNQWKTLRGHLEDVVDISWSSDGSILVSASVDNEAIVWDAVKGVKLHMLTGHKSWVQGVSFDPNNEHLVSLGADRNLRVYNCSTRKFMYKVDRGSVLHGDELWKTRLFYDYTLPSFTRRLAFSPGGEFLLAPSGVIEFPKKIVTDNILKANGEDKENQVVTVEDDENDVAQDVEMREQKEDDERMDADDEGDAEGGSDESDGIEDASGEEEDGDDNEKSGGSEKGSRSGTDLVKDGNVLGDTPKKKIKVFTKKQPKVEKKIEKKVEAEEDETDLGYVNVCHLFLRHDLKRPFCYFPTDKFCHAVRFCPIKFKFHSPDDMPETDFPYPYRIIFAIATQSSVILYDSSQLDPFGYISDIHYTRISDLSWSPDGRLLMISSTDGFCTFVTFEEGELGEPYEGETFEWEPEVKENKVMSDEAMEEIFSSVIASALAAPDSNSCHPEEEINMDQGGGEEVAKIAVQAPKPATPKTPSITSMFTKIPKSEALKKTFNSALFTSPIVLGSKRKEPVNGSGDGEVVIIDEPAPGTSRSQCQSPQVKKLKDSNGNATPGNTKKSIEKNFTSPSMLLVPVSRKAPENGKELSSRDFESLVGKSSTEGNITKIIDDNLPPADSDPAPGATINSTQSSKLTVKSPIKSDQAKSIVPRRVSFVTLTKPKEK